VEVSREEESKRGGILCHAKEKEFQLPNPNPTASTSTTTAFPRFQEKSSLFKRV